QGVHLVDLARWFAGDEVTCAQGILRTDFWPIEPLEDHALAWLEMRGGARFALELSLTQWKNLFSFEIAGELGTLIIDGLGGSYGPERLTRIERQAEFGAPIVQPVEEFANSDDCWAAQWAEMERAIRTGDPPCGSAADSLAALRIIEACRQSSKE